MMVAAKIAQNTRELLKTRRSVKSQNAQKERRCSRMVLVRSVEHMSSPHLTNYHAKFQLVQQDRRSCLMPHVKIVPFSRKLMNLDWTVKCLSVVKDKKF
jgi:hypothetical protein